MMDYIITQHARERWIERGGGSTDLATELIAGVRYGAQKGSDFSLLLPNDLVAIIRDGNVVVTIITKDHCIANMQMNGRRMGIEIVDNGPQVPDAKSLHKTLASLAADHATGNATEKNRMSELKALGIDLCGVDAIAYRMAYRAACLVKTILADSADKKAAKEMRKGQKDIDRRLEKIFEGTT